MDRGHWRKKFSDGEFIGEVNLKFAINLTILIASSFYNYVIVIILSELFINLGGTRFLAENVDGLSDLSQKN